MGIVGFIFWLLFFYFLFRFIVGFVIPVISATRNVRTKMKNFKENMGHFDNRTENGSTSQGAYTSYKTQHSTAGQNNSTTKGDYIDFEEIKD